MTTFIEKHRQEIKTLCQKYSVRRLQLFGSAARGEFDPKHSDLDFFVTFRDTDYRGSSDRFFGLLHGLEDLLQRRIDLVERSAVQNRIFLEVAQQHLEELYDGDSAAA